MCNKRCNRSHRAKCTPGSGHIDSVDDDTEDSGDDDNTVEDKADAGGITPIHIYAEGKITDDE